VRLLFRQIPNTFVAAMVVTAYRVATLHGKVPSASLAGWLGLQVLAPVHRGAVFLAYRRAVVDLHNAGRWARRYAAYMAVAGGVWGAAAALFLDDRQPLAIAFTLCGLYGITRAGQPRASALRYTERGGVLLAVRRERGAAGEAGWRIECRDSGVGIAAADQARVFEEFVQLHNPQRDRRLGLGLAIARRIGRLIGGDLMQGRVVTVIDDEASIREGVCMLLEQWGCVVHAAADAEAALVLSAGLPVLDLVLADLRLPGPHEGIAAVAALRDARPAPLLHKPVRAAFNHLVAQARLS